ncbi:MAG: tRNA (adenosine(37)-N6)-threonylcarbamoyltransferase complex transferase subunit TsaD [Spirochaetales bacterium]|nr:tRNA (adenosine(37)-N6)-threonylcarbamoyltransferase complex transferase subunit TsaD [Spirochaetales bacterium]
MYVLGIESSCDECAASVVKDGNTILSNVIATQIEDHRPWQGVVPEIASRIHTRWIWSVVDEALEKAGITKEELDGIAVTNRPGLVGSLLVGLSFAKGLAWSLDIPFTGVDHIRAHLYAPHLENDIPYPYLGLLVSGGHTVIAVVRGFDDIEVLGTTIDDACGEAFDKVAKHYELGYPGGVAIDRLSKEGDPKAFGFPSPNLHKGDHEFDVSYSGLKTAVINQLDQFHNEGYEKSKANIAASFQKRAVDILVKKVKKAIKHTGIRTVVAGGGVTANSYMRSSLESIRDVKCYYPSLALCTDNAAMIAGIGYQYFQSGQVSDFSENARARVPSFKRGYP